MQPPQWTRLREALPCQGCRALIPVGAMAWWQPGIRACGTCGPGAGIGWRLLQADWTARCACGSEINPGALFFWRPSAACGKCLPAPAWWPR